MDWPLYLLRFALEVSHMTIEQRLETLESQNKWMKRVWAVWPWPPLPAWC